MVELIQLVSNFGFPVVAFFAAFYMLKDNNDKQRADIMTINDRHADEIKELTSVINNNTQALIALCEKIEGWKNENSN